MFGTISKQHSDLKLLGRIFSAVGFLFFLFALFTYFYEERVLWMSTYPYRQYLIPLLFVAVLFCAVSLLLDSESRKRKTIEH